MTSIPTFNPTYPAISQKHCQQYNTPILLIYTSRSGNIREVLISEFPEEDKFANSSI